MGSDPRRAAAGRYQGSARAARRMRAEQGCRRAVPAARPKRAVLTCCPQLLPVLGRHRRSSLTARPGPAAPPAPTNRPPTAPLQPRHRQSKLRALHPSAAPGPAPRPFPAAPAGRGTPGCCLGSRWQCGEPVCPRGTRSTPYFINIPFSSIPAPRFLPGHSPRLAPAPERCPLLPRGCGVDTATPAPAEEPVPAVCTASPGWAALPGPRPSPPVPAGSPYRRALTAWGCQSAERARPGTAAARSELPRAPRTRAPARETGAGPAAGHAPASRPLAASRRRRRGEGPRATSGGRGQQGAPRVRGRAGRGRVHIKGPAHGPAPQRRRTERRTDRHCARR